MSRRVLLVLLVFPVLAAFLVGARVLAVPPSPAVELWLPAPSPLARNVGGRTVLSWAVEPGTLLPNGSFEDGTNGWSFVPNGTRDGMRLSTNAATGSVRLPPVEGTNTLRLPPGQLSLELTLPSLGSAVALGISYAETGALGLSSQLEFVPADPALKRVELIPDMPAFDGLSISSTWRRRGADLTDFAGQRGTLVWTFPSGDLVAWFLDDIRFTFVPAGTEFDVWFSDEQTRPPAPLKHLGRTQRSAWWIKDQISGGAVRWRVDVITPEGVTEGPLWTFGLAPKGRERILAFDPPATTVGLDQPVPFTLQVHDERDFPTPNAGYSLQVQAFSLTSAPASVRITEIDTSQADRVELRNLSDQPVDLSGWRLELFSSANTLTGAVSVPIPPGSILSPGAHATFSEGRPASSTRWPDLRISSIDWYETSTFRAGLTLRDAANQIVDAFFAESSREIIMGTEFPRQSPSVGPGHWLGLPVTNRPTTTLTFQRFGARDLNQASDWRLAAPTFGTANTDLVVPALPGSAPFPVEFVGSTNVRTRSPDGRVGFGLRFPRPDAAVQVLVTATRSGEVPVIALSPAFAVGAASYLELLAPSSLAENAPATAGPLRVRLSEPAPTDIPVRLEGWASDGKPLPAALALPHEGVIPAGTTELALDLLHPEDTLLTGPRLFSLVASAPNYASVLHPLVWEENDVATLQLELPPSLAEGQSARGNIRLDRPVDGVFDVELHAEPPGIVNLPSRVRFFEGIQAEEFGITAWNDTLIAGSQSVTITASYPGWASASRTLERLDDDTRTFDLSAGGNGTTIEGGILSLHVVLGGTLTNTLTVRFESSDPTVMVAPSPVEVSPGRQILDVVFEAPEDALTTGSRTVLLKVTAPEFTEATIPVTVLDTDPARLRVDLPPGPFAPGETFEARVVAETLDGRPLPSHPLGELTTRLVGAPDTTTYTPGQAIPGLGFTALPGSVSRPGSGFGLEVTATTLTGTSPPFSVWTQGAPTEVRYAIYDAARDQFLVVPENPDGPLQFVSGSDGTRTDLVPSPTGIVDMALTSDGHHVAVLDLAGTRLATLNLATRTMESEVRFGDHSPNRPWVGRSLAAAPGLSNAVVVARWHGTNDALGGDLSLYQDNLRRPTTAPIPFLKVEAQLASDFSEPTVSLLNNGVLNSFPVSADGVSLALEPAHIAPCFPANLPFPSQRLLRSHGVVIDPCLVLHDSHLPGVLPDQSPAQEIVARAIDPLTGRWAILRPDFGSGNALGVYTPHAPQRLSETYLSPSLAFPAQLGWAGSNRWLVIAERRLHLVATTEPTPVRHADLSVLTALLRQDPDQGTSEVLLRVENHGPDPADHVVATFGLSRVLATYVQTITPPTTRDPTLGLNNGLYVLGDLAAGASTELTVTLAGAHDSSLPAALRGHLAASVLVSALASDPVPDNNRSLYRAEGLLPNPVPALRIRLTNTPLPPLSTQSISLSFPSVPQHIYQMETQYYPGGAWEPDLTTILGTGNTVELQKPFYPSDPGPHLWRLRRLSPGF
ncbi:MAG: lamin tail domain-containing protein [Verrucomicrobiales bacterium]|nr:lamin tail domain-containing protein [Verrucomicrobiales bacterium]